jgi:hypothetical protein
MPEAWNLAGTGEKAIGVVIAAVEVSVDTLAAAGAGVATIGNE